MIGRNMEPWIEQRLANLSNRFHESWRQLTQPDSADGCKRILFSPRPDWEPMIRQSFGKSSEAILRFAPLTDASVAWADLVVPLTLDQQLLMTEHPKWCTPQLPIPTREVIELCSDKVAFNRALQGLGFGLFVPEMNGDSGYPYILKKRTDENSAHTYIVRGPGDERAYGEMLASPEYFKQRFVPGSKEYATHILFRDGQAVADLTIEYSFASKAPIKGKTPYIHRLAACPELPLLANMLRELKYEGLCCFNYKRVGMHPWIIELNPRFGGSLSLYFVLFVRSLNRSRVRTQFRALRPAAFASSAMEVSRSLM